MATYWPTTPAPARPKRKRARATVVVQQGGKTLLVRELREETKLEPFKAERLFDYEGTTQLHKVVRVQARGRVKLQRKEVSELPSAKAILRKFGGWRARLIG